jgi:hypothetical protein
MLLFLLMLIAIVVGPALIYVEYQRWRGRAYTPEPPFDAMNYAFDEMNHDPPKSSTEGPRRLPNITDIGI